MMILFFEVGFVFEIVHDIDDKYEFCLKLPIAFLSLFPIVFLDRDVDVDFDFHVDLDLDVDLV